MIIRSYFIIQPKAGYYITTFLVLAAKELKISVSFKRVRWGGGLVV